MQTCHPVILIKWKFDDDDDDDDDDARVFAISHFLQITCWNGSSDIDVGSFG